VPSATAPSPAEVAQLTGLLADLRRDLGAAACSVALVDGDELVFVAADGAGAADVLGLRIPLARGIAGWVAVSGQGIAVNDVHRDRRFDRASAEQTGYLPTAILAVPVEDDEDEEGGPLGVVEVLDWTPGPHDLEAAGATAAAIATLRLRASARARLDDALRDPGLSELLDLVALLAERPDRERRLAVRLLRALLEHDA
jgi:GAF domain-containing protein